MTPPAGCTGRCRTPPATGKQRQTPRPHLGFTGAPRPTRSQWRRLPVVALGVVVGFPLVTSLALTTQPSAHGAVVIAVLPAGTAVFAVLRAGERPPPPI